MRFIEFESQLSSKTDAPQRFHHHAIPRLHNVDNNIFIVCIRFVLSYRVVFTDMIYFLGRCKHGGENRFFRPILRGYLTGESMKTDVKTRLNCFFEFNARIVRKRRQSNDPAPRTKTTARTT